MRFLGAFIGLGLAAAALGGCALIHNEPINQPLAANAGPPDPGREVANYEDDLLIFVSFSGGGTRAAAFSHGVLMEMDNTQIKARGGSTSLLDRVDFVSGVSGGSVTAAYYGLKRRDALNDFREKFLLRDAEESLSTEITPINLVRAYMGGINDSRSFRRWLDVNLFEGATFGVFRADRRPRIIINAADIYNRTSFVFGQTSFTAMCSDLNSYPVSDAVAASAAVPLVFTPVVLQTFSGDCKLPLPESIGRARADKSAAPMIRSHANAVAQYRDGSMPYIKLLDGGLVDNYGLSGFTIARLSANTPYGPQTPRQGVKLRRALMLVVDAGRGPSGDWTKKLDGPTGYDLVGAVADSAMVAGEYASYTAFDRTMLDWQNELVRWRCGLSATERVRHGVTAGWNCRDVKFFVTRVGFDQLGPNRAAELDVVPTSFRLPAETVDMVISAGRDALRANRTYVAFLKSL
jgi:NTE family protein